MKCKTINCMLYLHHEMFLTEIIRVLSVFLSDRSLVRYLVNRKETKWFFCKASFSVFFDSFWMLMFWEDLSVLCHCYFMITSFMEFFSNKKPWKIHHFVMNKRMLSPRFVITWQVYVLGKKIWDFLYCVLRIYCSAREKKELYSMVFRLISQMRENGELLNGGSSEVVDWLLWVIISAFWDSKCCCLLHRCAK